MSTSYANVSFWGANQKEVVRAAQDMFPNSPCVISDKVNQWVTLFHEKFLLDSGALPQWGSQISRRIGRPAIGISIWYSTVFLYWVYDSNGATIDRSQPADPNEPTEIEARGRAGHPERIPRDLFGKKPYGQLVADAIESAPWPEDLFYAIGKGLEIEWFEYEYNDFYELDDASLSERDVARFHYIE